jgi:hypothetical protein
MEQCIVFNGFSIEESRLFFSKLSNNSKKDKKLAILTYGDHTPRELIFDINILRSNLNPKGCRLDSLFFDLCLQHKSKIIQLLTRQMISYNNLSHAEIEHLYYSTVLNCANFVKDCRISLIFSRTYPQFAFDYVLFLYCTSRGIPYFFEYEIPYTKTVVFSYAELDRQNFIIQKIDIKDNENDCNYTKNKALLIYEKILSSTLEADNVKNSGYHGEQANSYFANKMHAKIFKMFLNAVLIAIPEMVKSILLRKEIRYFTRFHVETTGKKGIPKNANALSMIKKSLISFYTYKKLLNRYYKLSENFDTSRNSKIKVLYFAHQEPEATILVEGGKFYTNYDAIKYMQSVLPDEAIIYYKEHQANFFYYDLVELGCEPENRQSGFYNFISLEDNIQFVPLDMSKKDIFDQVDLVVTICGTAGIEASIYGIPTIVLANPLYMQSKAENLISPEDFNFELIDEICHDKRKISESWVNFFSDILQSGVIEAPTNRFDVAPTINRHNSDYLTALSKTIDNLLEI